MFDQSFLLPFGENNALRLHFLLHPGVGKSESPIATQWQTGLSVGILPKNF